MQTSTPRALIAQISDLHIKPVGLRAYRQVDTAAALARCIKELNRFLPRPDFVVISGDDRAQRMQRAARPPVEQDPVEIRSGTALPLA